MKVHCTVGTPIPAQRPEKYESENSSSSSSPSSISSSTSSSTSSTSPSPPISFPFMLPNNYDGIADPAGWWIVKNNEGIRALWDGENGVSKIT